MQFQFMSTSSTALNSDEAIVVTPIYCFSGGDWRLMSPCFRFGRQRSHTPTRAGKLFYVLFLFVWSSIDSVLLRFWFFYFLPLNTALLRKSILHLFYPVQADKYTLIYEIPVLISVIFLCHNHYNHNPHNHHHHLSVYRSRTWKHYSCSDSQMGPTEGARIDCISLTMGNLNLDEDDWADWGYTLGYHYRLSGSASKSSLR